MPIDIAKTSDGSFFLNEDTVNKGVRDFLLHHKFKVDRCLTGREHGVDVEATKDNWKIYVESKGSKANSCTNNDVFDNNQIWDHLCKQIGKLLEYRNKKDENLILVAANPGIERIKKRVKKLDFSLFELGVVLLWIDKDGIITIECSDENKSELKLLGLPFKWVPIERQV